ncbi:MAG: PspC domain-containing protein [Chitinophagaceae bacterium]|nr:PspC domain-containing protein [Chitinophagaceae bacterium]
MKKVININFQGRVIPIEEPAYDVLKQYTDSLRRYFAKEEGRDEIISDIENRIAELFSENLKKGATCITETEVNAVIAGIGRPEDFDGMGAETSAAGTAYQQQSTGAKTDEPRGSLYRNDKDKILGGVCSGLANYLRIDPTIVRILFALITFGGFGAGFLLYIILWIILPSRSVEQTIRRRLYRNPDGKVIAGVCSGIASYFNIGVWIPRLIFSLPLITGILNAVFRNSFGDWDFDPFPGVVFGGFGGTLFITYVILWIVVPFASTASEKLEMRGEKVDLESIKHTVQEELQSGKGRAEKTAAEIKDKVEKWGEEVKERGQAFATQVGPAAKSAGSGLGNAIGVLFKAFFLFVAGVVVFALFVALMAMIFAGVGIFPLKEFLLEGFWQSLLAWGTLLLFLGVPIIAAVIWLIRRIAGIKSKNNYLGYTFGSLWTIGWVCVILLASMITRNFKRLGTVKEDVTVVQPSKNRMIVDVAEVQGKYYSTTWFDDDDDFPFLSANEDSMLLNTVRIKVVKSNDSSYHVTNLKFARGTSPVAGEETAGKISFPITQKDSVLYLPKGFPISRESKFRNQQVLVVVEVPVGKMIKVDRSTDWYSWFTVNANYRRGINIQIDDDWDNSYWWERDVWYVMTENGLERVDKKDKDEENNDDTEKKGGEYRYKKGDTIDIKIKNKDTSVNIKINAEASRKNTEKETAEAGDETNKEGSETIVRRQSMISVFDVLKLKMN